MLSPGESKPTNMEPKGAKMALQGNQSEALNSKSRQQMHNAALQVSEHTTMIACKLILFYIAADVVTTDSQLYDAIPPDLDERVPSQVGLRLTVCYQFLAMFSSNAK